MHMDTAKIECDLMVERSLVLISLIIFENMYYRGVHTPKPFLISSTLVAQGLPCEMGT